jgi:hypothetical protein
MGPLECRAHRGEANIARQAAVDLAAREADALHQRRADVTTEQVLARL